jgi:hypothetical protein
MHLTVHNRPFAFNYLFNILRFKTDAMITEILFSSLTIF